MKIYLFVILVVFGTLIFLLFKNVKKPTQKLTNSTIDAISKKINEEKPFVPNKMDLTEIYNDIYLEPYGCFSSLDEKFFQKQINMYSKNPSYDSGIIISDDNDTTNLINRVINNGFDQYGYKIIHQYKNNYDKMSIVEIGILGKLAGYSYLSVYKLDERKRGKVYLTYSPPMDQQVSDPKLYKSNLTVSDHPDYTLTPKLNNYTNELEKAPGKELSCGYPCLSNGEPLMFNDERQMMCGSVGYPDITKPTRFSVYKISEKH